MKRNPHRCARTSCRCAASSMPSERPDNRIRRPHNALASSRRATRGYVIDVPGFTVGRTILLFRIGLGQPLLLTSPFLPCDADHRKVFRSMIGNRPTPAVDQVRGLARAESRPPARCRADRGTGLFDSRRIPGRIPPICSPIVCDRRRYRRMPPAGGGRKWSCADGGEAASVRVLRRCGPAGSAVRHPSDGRPATADVRSRPDGTGRCGSDEAGCGTGRWGGRVRPSGRTVRSGEESVHSVAVRRRRPDGNSDVVRIHRCRGEGCARAAAAGKCAPAGNRGSGMSTAAGSPVEGGIAVAGSRCEGRPSAPVSLRLGYSLMLCGHGFAIREHSGGKVGRIERLNLQTHPFPGVLSTCLDGSPGVFSPTPRG